MWATPVKFPNCNENYPGHILSKNLRLIGQYLRFFKDVIAQLLYCPINKLQPVIPSEVKESRNDYGKICSRQVTSRAESALFDIFVGQVTEKRQKC